jgi:Protein of unknown function (DUF1266)
MSMLKLPAFAAVLLSAAVLTSSCAQIAGTAPTAAAPTATAPTATAPAATTLATGAKTPPANGYPEPASACSASGGKYLGHMKCEMADGSIVTFLVGVEAQSQLASSTPVPRKSPHAWALATTAIIFEFNGHRHDLLSGTVATPDGQEDGKNLLSQSWGINSQDELVEMLHWLQFEGHRSGFEVLGSRVDALNESEFARIEAAAQNNPQALNQLEIVRKDHRRSGEKGILAWDLVRYIALCRWGYLAGYLSEAEAWDYIMPAARRLQLTFASWQNLQSDFLIGRKYWSLQQTEKNGEAFRSIYELFIQDPNSPWNVNPWTMDLGVATPLQIKAN